MSVSSLISFGTPLLPPGREVGSPVPTRLPVVESEPGVCADVVQLATGATVAAEVVPVRTLAQVSAAPAAKLPSPSRAPAVLSMEAEIEGPRLGPSGVKALGNWADTLKTVDSYKASILVLGFGSKGQYKR